MMKNDFFKKYGRGMAAVFAFFLLWEISVRMGFVDKLFISTPIEIFNAAVIMFSSGSLNAHLIASGQAFFWGFFSALLFGVLSGLIIGYNKNIHEYFKPFIYALSALPKVSIIPLIIIWFGIGISSKIAFVFLAVFVPILIVTTEGVKNADKGKIIMAKSFGFSDSRILYSIIFFEALPYIFSGMRIAVGRGVVGVVIAEVFGYGIGLGYLVSYYGGIFQTARLFVVIFLLLFLTLLMTGFIAIMEKKFINWK